MKLLYSWYSVNDGAGGPCSSRGRCFGVSQQKYGRPRSLLSVVLWRFSLGLLSRRCAFPRYTTLNPEPRSVAACCFRYVGQVSLSNLSTRSAVRLNRALQR